MITLGLRASIIFPEMIQWHVSSLSEHILTIYLTLEIVASREAPLPTLDIFPSSWRVYELY